MIRKTPLVAAPSLGRDVWLKLESLQLTGSFKIRGAWMALNRLSPEKKASGVITASAGNHGAGVALAAQSLSIEATIVIPRSTPNNKKKRMLSLGAMLVEVEGGYDDAEAFAKKRAAQEGKAFVSPYDDEDIIAGNGDSLALEIKEQCPMVRSVVVPVGGGGLVSGIARTLCPDGVVVHGASPLNNCAMAKSLDDDRAHIEYEGKATMAEGLEGGVATRTFDIVRTHGVQISRVTEDQIAESIRYGYETLGMIFEPSASVALAGFKGLAKSLPQPTVIVITGSNIDSDALDQIIHG